MTATSVEIAPKNGASKHHETPHSQIIAIDSIGPSPLNPRKNVTADPDLQASIKANGQRDAIKVRPAAGKGKDYELVDGERRWKAMKANGDKMIRCDVEEMSDEQAIKWMLSQKAHDKALTPLEEAEGFASYRDISKKTPEEIAAEIAKPIRFVQERLALMKLSPAAKKALGEDRLKLGAARELSRLEEHAAQDRILPQIVANEFSAAADAKVAQAMVLEQMRKLKLAPFDVADAKLVAGVCACTSCPKNSANDTKDMFDPLPGDPKCRDGACWLVKIKANGVKILDDAKANGLKIIEDTKGMWEPSGDRIAHVAPWVDLAGSTYVAGGNHTTWAQIAKDAALEVFVAVDPTGHPHQLVDKKAADKAVAALEPKKAPSAPRASSSSAKGPKTDAQSAEEAEARAISAALVAKAEKATPGVIIRIAIARELTGGDCDMAGVVERRGLKAVKGSLTAALDAWIEKAHSTELQGLYVELLATHDQDDARDECVKALKVDVTDVRVQAVNAEKKRQADEQKKADAALKASPTKVIAKAVQKKPPKAPAKKAKAAKKGGKR